MSASSDYNTPVDPRIQVELEKLNTATDNINKYEVELDEAKCDFKRLLTESVERIKQSTNKLGNSVQAAKPYYEARIYAAQLSRELQTANGNYEKAKSVHAAAKEMVYLAEQGLGEKSTLDTACQEMLSHAASRVNQSQIECTETRNILKMCELKHEVASNRVTKLQSQLKAAIKASNYNIRRTLLLINLLAYQHDLLILPYYETRANYNGVLKSQKEKISGLEMKITDAKLTYNEALKNLEQISEEIHRMRQEQNNFLNFEAIVSQNSFKSDNSFENFHNFPCEIDSSDEYLEIPSKLSTNSSPIRQRHPDVHECPHLLQDFESVLKFPNRRIANIPKSASTTSDSLYSAATSVSAASSQYHNHLNLVSTVNSEGKTRLDDEIEQWTEIRLSNSESTSSSYSHHNSRHSILNDDHTPSGSDTSDDNRKITCTNVFGVGGGGGGGGGGGNSDLLGGSNSISKQQHQQRDGGGITTWITRSSSFKSSGRRQSLDLLIDAGDKVKDVFTFGFQKVGKSLERRNSESEMSNDNSDFFSFSRSDKEVLSDEQVENLLLLHEEEGVDTVNLVQFSNLNDISN